MTNNANTETESKGGPDDVSKPSSSSLSNVSKQQVASDGRMRGGAVFAMDEEGEEEEEGEHEREASVEDEFDGSQVFV